MIIRIKNKIKEKLPEPFWKFYGKFMAKIYPQKYLSLSDDFINLFPAFLKENKIIELSSLIRRTVPCKKEHIDKLFFLYELREKQDNEFQNLYEVFQREICLCPYNLYSYTIWQCLKTISTALGFFKLAYSFRKKAIENILEKKKSSISYFLALMEQKKYEDAKVVLNNLRDINPNEILPLSNYFCLLTKGKINDCKKKDSYYTYLSGKDICIIGPAFDGDEKAFDRYIIVKNNIVSSIHKELIPNISYYNQGCFDTMIETNEFFNTPPNMYYCFKNQFSIKKIPLALQVRSHECIPIYSLFEFSGPLMLPIMLMDLLSAPIKSLSVFGNNMYTGTIYNSNYVYQGDLDKYVFWSVFAGHGIIENYFFIKHFYEKGLFTADSILDSVLKTGIEQYLDILEKRWVIHSDKINRYLH